MRPLEDRWTAVAVRLGPLACEGAQPVIRLRVDETVTFMLPPSGAGR